MEGGGALDPNPRWGVLGLMCYSHSNPNPTWGAFGIDVLLAQTQTPHGGLLDCCVARTPTQTPHGGLLGLLCCSHSNPDPPWGAFGLLCRSYTNPAPPWRGFGIVVLLAQISQTEQCGRVVARTPFQIPQEERIVGCGTAGSNFGDPIKSVARGSGQRPRGLSA